jgi:hypothetical protein
VSSVSTKEEMMKIKLGRRLAPTMVALISLLCLLGGSEIAGAAHVKSLTSKDPSTRSAHHDSYKLRFGKLGDTDTTAHDGVFSLARGHATCKRSERLIAGGLRLHKGSADFIAGHFALVESGPIPKTRQWAVTTSSDLGGEAHEDFLVVAYCLSQ